MNQEQLLIPKQCTHAAIWENDHGPQLTFYKYVPPEGRWYRYEVERNRWVVSPIESDPDCVTYFKTFKVQALFNIVFETLYNIQSKLPKFSKAQAQCPDNWQQFDPPAYLNHVCSMAKLKPKPKPKPHNISVDFEAFELDGSYASMKPHEPKEETEMAIYKAPKLEKQHLVEGVSIESRNLVDRLRMLANYRKQRDELKSLINDLGSSAPKVATDTLMEWDKFIDMLVVLTDELPLPNEK